MMRHFTKEVREDIVEIGDMVGDTGCPDGLYHQDTRFLSQLELRLNGDCPLLLSSNQAQDNSLLPVDLANADTIAADGSAAQNRIGFPAS